MADAIPRPVPDGDSQLYWDGIARGELLLQRCDACQRFLFYPRALCPHCSSDRISWQRASGQGTVYSYTVVHQAYGPFAGQVPYVVALVDLDEGVRMMTRIAESPPEAVRIGARVRVTFVEAGEGVTLPYFILASADEEGT